MLLPVTFKSIWAEDPDRPRMAKKPNVLVIMADDVGTGDVPGYFKKKSGIVDMPNLQRLLDEGTTFTDAHSTPLCAPSRYVFLSGNYQHRGSRYPGLWNLNYKMNQFKPGQQSIARVMRDNGYSTFMGGKWHLGGRIPTNRKFKMNNKFYAKKDTLLSEDGHDWTKPIEEGPWDIGFEKSMITTGGIQSPPYVFFRDGMMDIPEMDELTVWEKGNYSMDEGLSFIKTTGEGNIEWDASAYNMILANETLSYIDNQEEESPDKPFFVYMAMSAVHVPHSPPDSFIDGTPIAGQYGNAHLDVLLELDKVVGHMYDGLRARDILDETMIVFASDNGGLNAWTTFSDAFGHYSNGPLRGSKGTVYEGGIRIPMTIRWGKGLVPRGEKRSKLIGLNDLYRTICGLAGVKVPNGQAIDSVDFSRYVLDGRKTYGTRNYLGAWYYDSSRLEVEAMRFNEMKLVRDYQQGTSELFNLTADPTEERDISDHNNDLVVKLFKRLRNDGPCHDKHGQFQVAIKHKQRNFKYISCYWIRQKRTVQRCDKYPEAQEQCGYTCAGRNKQYCAKDLYSDQKMFKIFNNTY